MGADLYIEPMHEKNCKALAPVWNKVIKERDAMSDIHGRDSDKCKVAQEKVEEIFALMNGPEFCFRDSYNCFSTLNAFNLSWWNDFPCNEIAFPKFQNGSPEVPTGVKPEALKAFIARLEAATEVTTEYDPKQWKHSNWNDKGNVTKTIFKREVIPYWKEDREKLLRFLKTALAVTESGDGYLVASC